MAIQDETALNISAIDLKIPTDRLKTIRGEMSARGLDALLIYSQRRNHVAYVSGYRPNYHTNSAFAVFPLSGEPTLVIKFGFDLPRARSMSWCRDIRTIDGYDANSLARKCFDVLGEKDLLRGKIGIVAGDESVDELSAEMLNSLKRGLQSAQLEPFSDVLTRLRLLKSADEVAQIRRSTGIAESAANAMQRCLVPGREDYEAFAEVSSTAIREGAERCDLIISPRPQLLTLPPAHHRFMNGSAVNCELTACYEGYWIQICRTYSIGQPSAAQKRIFAACRDSYEAAVEAARPGSSFSDMARAAERVLEKAGYAGCVKYGLGHGVGLDLPEPYDVDVHCNEPLLPQMIVVVHIGAWAPDNESAAFVGGPIVVTQTGADLLDTPQTEMIVV